MSPQSDTFFVNTKHFVNLKGEKADGPVYVWSTTVFQTPRTCPRHPGTAGGLRGWGQKVTSTGNREASCARRLLVLRWEEGTDARTILTHPDRESRLVTRGG